MDRPWDRHAPNPFQISLQEKGRIGKGRISFLQHDENYKNRAFDRFRHVMFGQSKVYISIYLRDS